MRAILIWASIATGAAFVCLVMVLGFHAFRPIRTQREIFLVGPLDPSSAFALAFGLGVVAVCGVLIASWWRAERRGPRIVLGLASTLAVLLAIPACGLLGLLTFIATGSYTEISTSEAGRPLVIREVGFLFSGGAHVYEREGAMLHWIAKLPAAGDTYQPFGRGDFDVIRSGDHVVLRWQTEDPPGSDWVRLP